MDKLKIGIVCYPSIGGSGIVATQLGQALCQLRYEVHFLSHDYPQRLGTGSRRDPDDAWLC